MAHEAEFFHAQVSVKAYKGHEFAILATGKLNPTFCETDAVYFSHKLLLKSLVGENEKQNITSTVDNDQCH